MYVILVNEDNSLTVSVKERIMQRSKLVDDLCFMVKPDYKGYDMRDFTVLLEYVLPVIRTYRTEILTLAEEEYNGRLQYVLPFDTCLTSEAGQIEAQLSFTLVDLDDDGKPIQRVRKTSTVAIDITPISAWSDIIPDSALTAIDQRIIKTEAQIKELKEFSEAMDSTKADNISYNAESGELQLLSGSTAIGDKVTIISCAGGDDGNDELPVVEF